MFKFMLFDLIQLAPDTVLGTPGADVAAGDKGSAPASSAADLHHAEMVEMLYPSAKKETTSAEADAAAAAAKVAADKATADAAKTGTGAEGTEKADADAAAAKAAADKLKAEKDAGGTQEPVAQRLTAEKKAELEKALADAGEDATKKAEAQAALDKAVADDKTVEEAEAAKAAEAAKPENQPFAPDKITLPEGMSLDERLLQDFAPVAKELGLPQKAGQKLVDQYIKIKQGEAASYAETVKGWFDSAKADPVIGRGNWDKSVADGMKAVRYIDGKAGNTKLTELLQTGIGNHPEMIRSFALLGSMIKDDDVVVSTTKADPQETMVDILYPYTKT